MNLVSSLDIELSYVRGRFWRLVKLRQKIIILIFFNQQLMSLACCKGIRKVKYNAQILILSSHEQVIKFKEIGSCKNLQKCFLCS